MGQLRCYDKVNICAYMQASAQYSLYRDMQAYPTQTIGELVGGFVIGVTSVVYIRTAFGDYGTPSVMLLRNIRAPKRRWGNCVATIK